MRICDHVRALASLFLTVAGLNVAMSQPVPDFPDPVKNPESPLMLSGDWVPVDTHKIDFAALPRVPLEHVVVSDVSAVHGVNQHNYLTYHLDRYWVMWSDGPGIEDQVGQRVSFATSSDGLEWSEPQFLSPEPPDSGKDSPYYGQRTDKGFRYISRGFWQREGELLALASLDEAGGFFGPSLELHAFRLDPKQMTWDDMGVVYDDTINNFPPKKLPTGEWMMSRRTHDRDVYFLVGGVETFDQWQAFPAVSRDHEALLVEEPYWWVLPDGNLVGLYRDNRKSHYLFRSFSTDNGRTWSRPTKTNFPDATSKFNGLRLSDGRYVFVSNPNPAQRDPLALSISDDGLVFHTMDYLIGGRRVDYPHVLERDGFLFVAFSGAKSSVEVLRIRIEDLNHLQSPGTNE